MKSHFKQEKWNFSFKKWVAKLFFKKFWNWKFFTTNPFPQKFRFQQISIFHHKHFVEKFPVSNVNIHFRVIYTYTATELQVWSWKRGCSRLAHKQSVHCILNPLSQMSYSCSNFIFYLFQAPFPSLEKDQGLFEVRDWPKKKKKKKIWDSEQLSGQRKRNQE